MPCADGEFYERIRMVPSSQICKHGAALRLEPAEQQHTRRQRHHGKGGHECHIAYTPADQEEAGRQQGRIHHAAQQGQGHSAALLDGSDLTGPVEIGHFQA